MTLPLGDDVAYGYALSMVVGMWLKEVGSGGAGFSRVINAGSRGRLFVPCYVAFRYVIFYLCCFIFTLLLDMSFLFVCENYKFFLYGRMYSSSHRQTHLVMYKKHIIVGLRPTTRPIANYLQE